MSLCVFAIDLLRLKIYRFYSAKVVKLESLVGEWAMILSSERLALKGNGPKEAYNVN